MVLDATLLNTQHYKVCIKDKVEQSRDRSCAWELYLMKKEPSGHPRVRSPTLLSMDRYGPFRTHEICSRIRVDYKFIDEALKFLTERSNVYVPSIGVDQNIVPYRII